MGEWSKNYGSEATERKVYVGKGIKYFSNIGVAEFLVEAAEMKVGDKLLITGPTTGAVFLTLDEVRVIYDTIQKEQIKGPNGELVRIEMFCHGALCMAVSGKCYLSLHEMNASANRGACMQICRHRILQLQALLDGRSLRD